jgi:glycine cleavage system H lipoate-binding protein
MGPHDILSMASVKAAEYLIAIGYLLLFVPFWRFVQGRAVAVAAVPATLPADLRRDDPLVEWFRMAPDVAYHPGHAWVRRGVDGTAQIGIDDFARKLVGPLDGIELPAPGTEVRQGEPAWRLRVDGHSFDVLSPVDGHVVRVNRDVLADPSVVGTDPFGDGWLLQVEASRFDANRRGLLTGTLARRWIEDATNGLRERLTPGLGLVLQDGGMPVDGLARAIDEDGWTALARECFLTDEAARPGAATA